MITYEEHKAWLTREAALWDVELQGCIDAALFDEPRKHFLSIAFQDRYMKGFRDAKAKIDIQDTVQA